MKTILIIEDDKRTAGFLKRGLEEEQFEVRLAADGEEGVRVALGNRFDLIILDWMLPKKNGLSVLLDLREKQISTPILMLTAKDSVDDIVSGLVSGSDGYLVKPFSFTELVSRVRVLLRSNQHKKDAEIRYADMRLDPVSHKVWRGEKEISLTGKEYDLLEYFMVHKEQVVTRNMIAEDVWTGTFDPFTNIIEVYVSYLRNKIDRHQGPKLINTVRGVGYMFKEGR